MNFMFNFWNKPERVSRISRHQELRRKNQSCLVPGYHGDPTDRGQPQRFNRWYKLPRKALLLYWRFHKSSVDSTNF